MTGCTYKNFLPQVIAAIAEKKRTDQGFDTNELESVVATAFQDTVMSFAKRSETLTQTLPIDVYQGVTYYPLQAPDGFIIYKILKVLDDCFPFDGAVENNNAIALRTPPDADYNNAFHAEVALIPVRGCELPSEYCVEHRDVLLDGIFSRVFKQKVRPWYDLDLADRHTALFNSGVENAEQDVTMKSVEYGTYEMFLPEIMPSLGRKTGGEKVSIEEVRAIVSSAFSATVIDFARRTKLYNSTVVIDTYEGVTYYPIDAPAGFHLLGTHNIKPPVRASIDSDNNLHLCTPPACDVNSAYLVEVALLPKHNNCDLDKEFVDRYYEAILAGMRARLSIQQGRQWASLGVYDRLTRVYDKLINTAKRRSVGSIVKTTTERLSHANKSIPHIQ